ncbi:ferredoxin [Lentisphaerota bacterium ZTH]|nr:ferredoxin [Lentisphaerota bacterium]WET05209.1 ferredoxin [Lentisphaerota bacterium ZTH]
MKVKIDPVTCIGCGRCCCICPEIFEINDGIAILKMDPVPPGYSEKCMLAAMDCPLESIFIEEVKPIL